MVRFPIRPDPGLKAWIQASRPGSRPELPRSGRNRLELEIRGFQQRVVCWFQVVGTIVLPVGRAGAGLEL
eukprot:2436586-Alexandrium_andersonii.AAC.1